MPHASPCLISLETTVLSTTLGGWKAAFPEMGVLALLPEAEKESLPLLQAVCRDLGVPLAGGIFPELLTVEGFARSGAWLLRLDQMVPAFLVPDMGGDPVDAALRLAALAEPHLVQEDGRNDAQPTLYLFVDALLQNIATMLDALYLKLADRVTYAGVAAGSESFLSLPCVFKGDETIANGALALIFPGEMKTVLEHGFPAPEKVMTVTSTRGNRIVSIDWQPAFEVYREIVRVESGVLLDQANFYQWAVGFPFGILRANGELVVRIPVALADDGCIQCIGEIMENAMLVVLRAPTFDGTRCADMLAEKLAAGHSGAGALDLLLFYCAGRRMQLGDGAMKEVGKLAINTEARLLAGALSLGEIGSTTVGGYPLFHNATLVCTTLPPS
jgi:hypothetical protein